MNIPPKTLKRVIVLALPALGSLLSHLAAPKANETSMPHEKCQDVNTISSTFAEFLECGSKKNLHQGHFTLPVYNIGPLHKIRDHRSVGVQDSVASSIHRHPLPKNNVHEKTIVSPSIPKKLRTDSRSECDVKTKKNVDLSNNQPANSDIGANFIRQKGAVFEEVDSNEEENIRLAKILMKMNESLKPTFCAIRAKHGDITKDCPLESGGSMLNSILELICTLFQELERKHLDELHHMDLISYYGTIKDAEKIQIDIKWFKPLFDGIQNAINSASKMKMNNEKKSDLQTLEADFEKLNSRIKIKRRQLNMETVSIEELTNMINDETLKIQQILNMSLMDAAQFKSSTA